jgi:hypothetical protein
MLLLIAQQILQWSIEVSIIWSRTAGKLVCRLYSVLNCFEECGRAGSPQQNMTFSFGIVVVKLIAQSILDQQRKGNYSIAVLCQLFRV